MKEMIEIVKLPDGFEIVPAGKADLPRIMEIYAHARAFMAEHGNPLQWGPTNWPPSELIRSDIDSGRCHVCRCGERIAAVFFFATPFDDPTYHLIEEGAWISDTPYGVVHRIASDGSIPGLGSACISWAFQQSGHLRIDTFSDNTVMRGLLAKLGFSYCGVVHVKEDPYPRMAFEKIAGIAEKTGTEYC